jgi:hypothetical protein
MRKISIGLSTLVYPMPALLVGANVNDKPNFMEWPAPLGFLFAGVLTNRMILAFGGPSPKTIVPICVI